MAAIFCMNAIFQAMWTSHRMKCKKAVSLVAKVAKPLYSAIYLPSNEANLGAIWHVSNILLKRWRCARNWLGFIKWPIDGITSSLKYKRLDLLWKSSHSYFLRKNHHAQYALKSIDECVDGVFRWILTNFIGKSAINTILY